MVKINGIYKHFKGNFYKVLYIAYHSETMEKYVVYKALYKTEEDIYIRPYDMFISLVDTAKYPNVLQKYRFELQENGEDYENSFR